MKKGIIALSILCTGLLLLDPLKNISFASKDENLEDKINSNVVTNIEENNDKTNNENNKEENIYYENNDNISNEKEEVNESKVEKENIEKDIYEENKKEDVKVFEENEYIETSKEDKEVEYNAVLDKDEAESILKGINPELEYIYQGDENNFSALKEKNLTGYVFLPDVETDIGYFIDKTNSNVYFFHPSGYLELVK